MQYEPSILMFGKKFRTIELNVFSYNWNTIVTTNCDLELSAVVTNDKRIVTDIMSKDDMQANLIDTKNLHIIRLFGKEYPQHIKDELDIEDIKDTAVAMLSKVVEIIKRNGIILIEDFEEDCFCHKEFRKAFRSLYQEQKQVYFFNCKSKDQYIQDLEKQGIAVIIEESINDFFRDFYPENEEYIETTQSDKNLQIYIEAEKTGLPTSFNPRQLIETETFATLLSINLLNEVKIPQNMYKEYFYLFLKNSVREPQWYGYNLGFNLHRHYEDELYKKVKKGLESVGKRNNRPLLIVGQTGTGKSISLAAIAYKIFNEKKYPVIYINNPEISFHSNLEYKQKGINKKSSFVFNALDALIERLESMGATAILVAWDMSSYSTGRNNCYRLYQALLARGRKVYLVSTAYEINSTKGNKDLQDEYDEDSVLSKKFVECNATVHVSNESEQIREILLNKCKMDIQDVDNILNYYVRNNTNFLLMLYQAFDIIRGNLSKGVSKEAKVNLQELDHILEQSIEEKFAINNIFAIALKKVEDDLIRAGIVESILSPNDIAKKAINVAKDDFVKCLAVCSQFKLKMPYDFALRILGTYNSQIIQTLMKSTLFVISQDYFGNYEISLRTPLESSMYIEAKEMNVMEEVDCITKMLKLMKTSGEYGQQQEIRLCEKLIRIIGPNSSIYKNKYKRGYSDIIDTLKLLRVDYNIWEPILIAQEITYIREYYGRDESLEKEVRISWLKEAIQIAGNILSKMEYTGVSVGTRNAIIVESANSKLLLCQLNESNDSLLFKELRKDLRNVIRGDNLNYHAYVTLLKGSIIEYKNEMDRIKKISLLENMCSVADEMMFENPDIADSEYFQQQVAEIYTLLENSDMLQAYIDELVANGSAAGLYVKARKILLENKVSFGKPIENKFQENACKKVYEIFKDDRYRAVSEESESCQYMMLNVVWLMNNKEPIYLDGECWITKIQKGVWQEILNICDNFINKFGNDVEGVHQLAQNIRYIKALCLAQLEQYIESITMLKSIEENLALGRHRVFTKHMICESDGTPRKFTGRLGNYDEVNRSGSVFIDEFGKKPIYYHGPHMRTANLTEGIVFTDIEIGYSSIAPKAFRGIEVKE